MSEFPTAACVCVARGAGRGGSQVEVRYRDERGDWVCGPLVDVDGGAVTLGNLPRTPGRRW